MSIDQRVSNNQLSENQNSKKIIQNIVQATNSNTTLFRNIGTNSRYDTQRLNVGPTSVTPPIKLGMDKTAT